MQCAVLADDIVVGTCCVILRDNGIDIVFSLPELFDLFGVFNQFPLFGIYPGKLYKVSLVLVQSTFNCIVDHLGIIREFF